MMWWAICCALAACAGAGLADQPSDVSDLFPYAQRQSYAVGPDEMSYSAVRPMASRYWQYLSAPESPRLMELREGQTRPKRKMPSLSINNPMEVLRQRLMLEVARKQMREASQRQAFANRLFLQNVGKRGLTATRDSSPYGN